MKRITTTWNGPLSQAAAFVASVRKMEAEKERKRRMAAWFARIESERRREEVLSNQ